MSKPKQVARFIFAWIFVRPFVLISAFGYWVGSDNLTYWQCVRKMWKEPV